MWVKQNFGSAGQTDIRLKKLELVWTIMRAHQRLMSLHLHATMSTVRSFEEDEKKEEA